VICDGFISYLVGQSTVTTTVGERIHYLNAGSSALPHLVITRLSTGMNEAFDGLGALEFTDLDIDCKATDEATATGLADTIKGLFKDYTGTLGNQTVGAVLWTGQADSVEPRGDASEDMVFVTTLDFTVQHSTT